MDVVSKVSYINVQEQRDKIVNKLSALSDEFDLGYPTSSNIDTLIQQIKQMIYDRNNDITELQDAYDSLKKENENLKEITKMIV